MTAIPPSTSLLDSMKGVKLLKNLILDNVRAGYGHRYPSPKYRFSVTVSRYDSLYCAQAIVYTEKNWNAGWKILLESDSEWTTQHVVEDLYSKSLDKMGRITLQMYKVCTCLREDGRFWESDSDNSDWEGKPHRYRRPECEPQRHVKKESNERENNVQEGDKETGSIRSGVSSATIRAASC